MIAQSARFFDVENASPGQASFVCWRDRVPYDQTTYLNTLQRRGDDFEFVFAHGFDGAVVSGKRAVEGDRVEFGPYLTRNGGPPTG